MELQWKSTPRAYLRSVLRQVQNQEQTLELRLTEGMPDIGRVLCAWGQVQLRSKEWRTDTIHLGGGVNVWVLYLPEDGTEPLCVEGWIPFQAKWALPDSSNDGVIRADVMLRSVDGRTVSPRKILVRASLALLAEAMQRDQMAVYMPEDLPEGVCLLRQSYPLQLLQEAGEKVFSAEQTLQLSDTMPKKLLAYRLKPIITEQAVTAGRLIMRGHLQTEYVALDENDRICGGSAELPFAQFAELEQEYDKEASCAVTMAISDAECMFEADGLRVKCGLIAQYSIHSRCMLQVTEDAYSPARSVIPDVEPVQLPVLLDRLRQPLDANVELPVQDLGNVVDVAFYPDQPAQYREGDRLVVELPGIFQALYYDRNEQLQCAGQSWSGRWELPAEEGCNFRLSLTANGVSTTAMAGDRLDVHAPMTLDVQTCAQQQINMMKGLQLGEVITADPERPSLILRRCGGRSLWQLAKECGSTVDAIERANQLTGQPAAEQLLLIPVL